MQPTFDDVPNMVKPKFTLKHQNRNTIPKPIPKKNAVSQRELKELKWEAQQIEERLTNSEKRRKTNVNKKTGNMSTLNNVEKKTNEIKPGKLRGRRASTAATTGNTSKLNNVEKKTNEIKPRILRERRASTAATTGNTSKLNNVEKKTNEIKPGKLRGRRASIVGRFGDSDSEFSLDLLTLKESVKNCRDASIAKKNVPETQRQIIDAARLENERAKMKKNDILKPVDNLAPKKPDVKPQPINTPVKSNVPVDVKPQPKNTPVKSNVPTDVKPQPINTPVKSKVGRKRGPKSKPSLEFDLQKNKLFINPESIQTISFDGNGLAIFDRNGHETLVSIKRTENVDKSLEKSAVLPVTGAVEFNNNEEKEVNIENVGNEDVRNEDVRTTKVETDPVNSFLITNADDLLSGNAANADLLPVNDVEKAKDFPRILSVECLPSYDNFQWAHISRDMPYFDTKPYENYDNIMNNLNSDPPWNVYKNDAPNEQTQPSEQFVSDPPTNPDPNQTNTKKDPSNPRQKNLSCSLIKKLVNNNAIRFGDVELRLSPRAHKMLSKFTTRLKKRAVKRKIEPIQIKTIHFDSLSSSPKRMDSTCELTINSTCELTSNSTCELPSNSTSESSISTVESRMTNTDCWSRSPINCTLKYRANYSTRDEYWTEFDSRWPGNMNKFRLDDVDVKRKKPITNWMRDSFKEKVMSSTLVGNESGYESIKMTNDEEKIESFEIRRPPTRPKTEKNDGDKNSFNDRTVELDESEQSLKNLHVHLDDVRANILRLSRAGMDNGGVEDMELEINPDDKSNMVKNVESLKGDCLDKSENTKMTARDDILSLCIDTDYAKIDEFDCPNAVTPLANRTDTLDDWRSITESEFREAEEHYQRIESSKLTAKIAPTNPPPTLNQLLTAHNFCLNVPNCANVKCLSPHRINDNELDVYIERQISTLTHEQLIDYFNDIQPTQTSVFIVVIPIIMRRLNTLGTLKRGVHEIFRVLLANKTVFPGQKPQKTLGKLAEYIKNAFNVSLWIAQQKLFDFLRISDSRHVEMMRYFTTAWLQKIPHDHKKVNLFVKNRFVDKFVNEPSYFHDLIVEIAQFALKQSTHKFLVRFFWINLFRKVRGPFRNSTDFKRLRAIVDGGTRSNRFSSVNETRMSCVIPREYAGNLSIIADVIRNLGLNVQNMAGGHGPNGPGFSNFTNHPNVSNSFTQLTRERRNSRFECTNQFGSFDQFNGFNDGPMNWSNILSENERWKFARFRNDCGPGFGPNRGRF